MEKIVYWLKQIFGAISTIAENTSAIAENSSASEDVTPAEPSVMIVEGALDTSGQTPVFEAAEDAPTYDEAETFITEGKGVVFLTYGGVYEMITLVGADALSGSESSWLKPSSQEEAAA